MITQVMIPVAEIPMAAMGMGRSLDKTQVLLDAMGEEEFEAANK